MSRTFIALNAASPWLQGSDSGFDCVRPNLFSAFPDNGPMPWAASWDEFRRLFRQLSYTSMIESIKDLHWDIRPSPHFGTVEVRVMDTPLTLARAISMAGFIQTLSHWLLATRPFKHQPEDYLLYKFNRYQACRFGLQGTLTDVHTGEQRTIADDLSALLENSTPSPALFTPPAPWTMLPARLKAPTAKRAACATLSATAVRLSAWYSGTAKSGRQVNRPRPPSHGSIHAGAGRAQTAPE